MNCAHPYVLLLLFLLPLLAWLRGRRGRQPAFLYSSVQLVKGITGIHRSSAGSILPKMRWLALACFIVALAQPRLIHSEAKVKESGVDIVVALDLSGSMASEDEGFVLNGQQATRFIIAKDTLKKFIARRTSDRLGLVVFATQAYVAALNAFLLQISPAPDSQTCIAKLVFDVVERFDGALDNGGHCRDCGS